MIKLYKLINLFYKKASTFDSNTIFYARSHMCPKDWSFDHVGFVTSNGTFVQMSGHKQEDGVYTSKSVDEDSQFDKQDILIIKLPVVLHLSDNSSGLQNCGMYVQKQLEDNNINITLDAIYNVMKMGKSSVAALLDQIK